METSEVCIFASQLRTRALSSAGSERLPYKQRVGGSNPSAPTTKFFDCASSENIGRLAQLVQSVCLTSRGSGVRIPQRPLPIFPFQKIPIPNRALSSAGSERLPYKQRVGGSNPSAPTTKKQLKRLLLFFASTPPIAFFLRRRVCRTKGRGGQKAELVSKRWGMQRFPGGGGDNRCASFGEEHRGVTFLPRHKKGCPSCEEQPAMR